MIKRFLAILILLAFISPTFAEKDFECKVTKVLSGNTFRCSSNRKVELMGVYTPAFPPEVSIFVAKKNGGQAAKEFLESLIKGKKLHCKYIKRNIDVVLSNCSINGKDLGEEIRSNGYATSSKPLKRQWKKK